MKPSYVSDIDYKTINIKLQVRNSISFKCINSMSKLIKSGRGGNLLRLTLVQTTGHSDQDIIP